jgi:hypothetical protein
MPARNRFQTAFLPSRDSPRFEKLRQQAATLIDGFWKSPIIQWTFSAKLPPESNVRFDLPGRGCDVVLHVALQRRPGVRLSTVPLAACGTLHRIDWMTPVSP